jgi:hypothetical protein
MRPSQQEQVLLTLDSGRRPFKISFNARTQIATIGKQHLTNTGYTYLARVWYMRAFVGLESTKEDDPYYIGNSVLLRLTSTQYMFVGRSIYTFTCESVIQDFYTPVSDRDVPYPYGVDDRGRHWLFEISEDSGIPVLKRDDTYYRLYPDRDSYGHYWRHKIREQETGLKSKDVELVTKDNIVWAQAVAGDDVLLANLHIPITPRHPHF